MAKQKTISSFFKENRTSPEILIRESYLRAVKDVLDSFGIDKYSVERIQGMTQVIEQFSLLQEEIDK